MKRWLLLVVCLPALAAEPLPALRAAAGGVTTSGLSAGGFMAVQLHVAYSSVVSGAGAIAGGPYFCAQGSLWTALYNCMTPGSWTPVPAASLLKSMTEAFARSNRIDPLKNLSGAPVWLFSGTQDRTVDPQVVRELARFYELYGAKTVLVADRPAGHGMPTANAGVVCGASEAPFLNACGYDAAGELLKHLLGPLNAPRVVEGLLSTFDQKAFDGAGLDDNGFVFIPKNCRSGGCRVHVAFHGCRQSAREVGERFAREAGYNRWADENRLIVLYPQVRASSKPWAYNPRGCWDWWGYSGAGYATRDGAQLRAVKAMLDRLASK
jgi:poly(3-hydroxybutyrate) depolymerase